MNKEPLSMEEAQKIGGAMHRLSELAQTKILSPQLDAERVGTIQYLQRVLVEYCDEFLASWFAVRTEYEPLIQGFAGLLSRATGIIQKSQAQRQQQAEGKSQDQTEAEHPQDPENVIKLDRLNGPTK